MLHPFTLPFVQHGLWEVLLLAVGAGVLGPWVVARGLSFYAHGVAAATFPGLVVASGLGFAGPLGALGAALLFAGTVGRLASHDERHDHSTLTAMALVGALAVGVLLASDVFPAAINVNALLFGSLLLISDSDLVIAAVVSVVVVAATVTFGARWLAIGFDRSAAGSLGVRAGRPDALLLILVALVAVATLSAVGSLLAAALMVVPAATVRPWVRRMGAWQRFTVLLTAVEGVAGLWLSVRTNAPPGATISVLAGSMFTLSVLTHFVAGRRRRGPGRPSRRRRPAALALLALVALGIAGCGSSSTGATSDAPTPIPVVATTTQLGDIVRAVGGSAVDVHQILQPNTDPHEYEPRPQDVAKTADAKVVFLSGNGLDGWMDHVVQQSGGSPTAVDVGAQVPDRLPADAEEREASPYDPHWWHDPRNVEAAVGVIRDGLTKADPAASTVITASAAAYLRRVTALDAGIARCVASVPASQRKLVTGHDAFNYFARRYGITVVGAVIPSQTTEAQPSAGAVARLARLIRREHVHAIFPESSINPKLAQALARETGVTSNLTLYGDTLGPSGSDGATYLTMEQHNADAMLRGFTGGRRGCQIGGR